ncbi:DUF5678 domain-containing protein [Nannocystis sp. ILAH1]|uniref:DUF5678 domain-containing protein n=1 Tax=unclassified Nannocystis TaxID=2627009 RepID=UPI00226E9393|nr:MULTISPECIES: DUF5678 domain-containing protein [unclassified Nannocystis]MCY0988623.1 DUF5678 domain-containing protein [Nannocystis sp. ILAH1]MCY1067412.1 DUF5678 domain-containing protein [Nannocystis sp. RBIL2]
MQPHPQHSLRDPDAWVSPDAKPKKRAKAKKAAAKKKPAATKKPVKKAAAKKKAKAAIRKKPVKSAAFSASVAELVARLGDKDIARQVIASLALHNRLSGDELAELPSIAALRRELADSQRRLADLEQKLTELSSLVADLSAAHARTESSADELEGVEEDPYFRWLGDPSIEQYVGQHVALHATRGVVAHADSVDDVLASIRAQGLSLDDVCLATVPAFPF